MENFIEEKIRKTISELTPKNAIIILSSRNVESACTMTEPIYGTKYMIEPLSQEILNIY